MDVINKLLRIKDAEKRQLLFLGYLNKALERFNKKVVVIGGFALEFYSSGGYRTGDIDVIFADNILLDKILKKWKFKKIGRHWVHKKLDILIEAPGSSLHAGEQSHLVTINVNGLPVYFIGVEDLIIDRLNSLVYWKSLDDERWIKEMIFIHKKRIDWNYLKKQACIQKTNRALFNIMKKMRIRS